MIINKLCAMFPQPSKLKIDKYKKRIFEYAKDMPNLKRLKVEFIEERNIEKFDIQTIWKKSHYITLPNQKCQSIEKIKLCSSIKV